MHVGIFPSHLLSQNVIWSVAALSAVEYEDSVTDPGGESVQSTQ